MKKLIILFIVGIIFAATGVLAEDMYFNITFGPLNDTTFSLHANNGNLEIAGNMTLADKVTFGLGESIDNLVDGWVNVNGGLTTTDSIVATGDINATGRVCDGSGRCIDDLSHFGKNAIGPYLYNDSTNLYFNDTLLNETIVNEIAIQLGTYNALNATDDNFLTNSGGVVIFDNAKLNATINALAATSSKGSDGDYLYNDSSTYYFNASKLNETIIALDVDTNVSKLQIEEWGFLNGTDGDFIYTVNNEAYFNATKLNDTIQALDYCSGGQCGSLVINGNLTILGDYVQATVQQMTINGTFIPSLDGVFDLGSDTAKWSTVYANTLVGSLDWSNITNINNDDIFNIVDNGTFLYASDQRYNDTTYINNLVGGLNNLTIEQIAANIGNWSADKPNYITNHSSINMTNIYVEDFVAVRKIKGNSGQTSYIYFPDNSMVMHFE